MNDESLLIKWNTKKALYFSLLSAYLYSCLAARYVESNVKG